MRNKKIWSLFMAAVLVVAGIPSDAVMARAVHGTDAVQGYDEQLPTENQEPEEPSDSSENPAFGEASPSAIPKPSPSEPATSTPTSGPSASAVPSSSAALTIHYAGEKLLVVKPDDTVYLKVTMNNVPPDADLKLKCMEGGREVESALDLDDNGQRSIMMPPERGFHAYKVGLYRENIMVSNCLDFYVICPFASRQAELGDSISLQTLLGNTAKILTSSADIRAEFLPAKGFQLQKNKMSAIADAYGKRELKVRLSLKKGSESEEKTFAVKVKVKRPVLKVTLKKHRKMLVVRYGNVKNASKVYVQMYFGKKKGYKTVNKILKIKPANTKGGTYKRKTKFQKITYQIKVKYKNVSKPQYSAKVTK